MAADASHDAACKCAAHLLQPLLPDAHRLRDGEAVRAPEVLPPLHVLRLPWQPDLRSGRSHEAGGGSIHQRVRPSWSLGSRGLADLGSSR